MDNLKGMAWMTLAMLAFALADMTIVFMSRDLPVGQIVFLLGTGGTILFGLWAIVQGHRWWSPVFLMRSVMVRNAGEVAAAIAFITALSLIPLSQLSAVIQANPLLVTLGAALFLGERVGWRRWTAIIVGLIGVLIIIRPVGAGFDANILWAVAAAIGLSLRDIATRPVPKTVPTTLLASYSFASVSVAGLVLMPFAGGFAPIPVSAIGFLFGCILASMVAVFAITAAMRVGEVAVVTPFRYTRLVFAFLIAVYIFGETLDVWTLVGVSIVVATGLYTLWREALRKRPA